MRPLHEYPLLRLLLAYIAGIIIPVNSDTCNHPQWLLLFILIVSNILFLVFHFFSFSSFRKNRTFMGFLCCFIFFLSGYYLSYHSLFNNNRLSEQLKEGKQQLLVRVKGPSSSRTKTFRMNAEVLGMYDGRTIKSLEKIRIMLYMAKDKEAEKIKFGDILLIQGNISSIPGPANPGQFNYKKYLERKGILKQVYVHNNEFIKVGNDNHPRIYKLALDTRDTLLVRLKNSGVSKTAYAISAAILLGYDDEISPELIRDYADTGVIHVLCVSGMHVGILYVLLNFLLFFMNKNRSIKFLKAIIILSIIWFYSLIAGFSPSVLRSAVMFSFILTGQTVGRNVDIRNSLLASAFFMLLVDPLMITDMGLILSYAAVFSIVLYNRDVLNWWTPRFFITRKLWEMTAVSISAQMLVFPVVMYYFHKFSNYFIVSNLIAIPLSTLVLYNGMLLLAVSPIKYLSVQASKGMDLIVRILNYCVGMINDLPFSSFSSLNLDIYRLLLIYGLILALTFFILSRKSYLFIISLFCLGIFLGLTLHYKYRAYQQKLLMIYSIHNHTAFSFIDGTTCYTFLDTSLKNDPAKYEYNIQSCITGLNIINHRIIGLEQQEFREGNLIKIRDMFCFYGNTLVIDNESDGKKIIPVRLRADILYIQNQKYLRLQDKIRTYDFQTLVINPSMRKKTEGQWVKECKKAGIDFHLLGKNGALKREIIIYKSKLN